MCSQPSGHIMEDSFAVEIYSPIDVIWEMMISAIDRPQYYMPVIDDFTIHAERSDGCDRSLHICAARIIDQITVDEARHIMRHDLRCDQHLSCIVTEGLTEINRHHVKLEIRAHCLSHAEFSDAQRSCINEGLKDAAIRIKFEAEEFWLGNMGSLPHQLNA